MAEHNLNYDGDLNKPVLIKNINSVLQHVNGAKENKVINSKLITNTSSSRRSQDTLSFWMQPFFCTNECMVEGIDSLRHLEEAGVQLLLHEKSVQEHQLMTSIQVGNIVKFQQISKVLDGC